MSFEKALKRAIQQKKFEILRKLGVPLVHFGIRDESESETNNILEESIHGAEALFFQLCLNVLCLCLINDNIPQEDVTESIVPEVR